MPHTRLRYQDDSLVQYLHVSWSDTHIDGCVGTRDLETLMGQHIGLSSIEAWECLPTKNVSIFRDSAISCSTRQDLRTELEDNLAADKR